MHYFQVKCISCDVSGALPTNNDNSLNTKGWHSYRPGMIGEYQWMCSKCWVSQETISEKT